jgi:ABC-type multidrug transport system fused ATPase/permease subunit
MTVAIKPENFPERVIWYTLLWTYGFFVIGGLYVVGSVVGWILFAYWVRQLWYQTDATLESDRIHIPWATWVWIISMIMMQVALVAGHLDFNLSTSLIIKSSIGWAKGWALLAVFPLVGTLKIRPQLMYRIACIIGFQSLLFFPIFLLAYLLHLPETPYVSPLRLVGGPGNEFFAPSLYEIDPSNGQPRWRLFAPWAPALGFVGNVYFVMALQERDRKWKFIGVIGAVFVCVISVSRLALLAMPIVFILTKILSSLTRPFALISLGITSMISGLISPMLIASIESFSDQFRSARADSSRVREALGRIAIDRWQSEAPIWGHGIVESGPHLVEYMPIGSHHSWFGLLFVKGIVGFAALAIPLFCSLVDLAIKAQTSEVARVGLSMVFILFLYTFGENLEILAYLYWPALVMIGMGFANRPAVRLQEVSYET